MPFERREVPEIVLTELKAAASREGAWLHIIQSEKDRHAIADLVAEGDRVQMTDPSFRRELAAWIHASRDVSHDGMPGFAIGLKGLKSSLAPIVVRTFDFGKGQAAKDQQLATGSPALALLGTDENQTEDWIKAGQALERIMLVARSENVWISFLNQPIEVPALRTKMLELLGVNGFPQLLLRLGYGPDVKPTPRRTAGEVLMRPLR
jgi:hypothetical protein